MPTNDGSSIPTLNDNDRIYFASAVDHDGSIMGQLKRNPKNYKFGFQVQLTLQVTQHTRRVESLQRLQTMLGGPGNIRGRARVSDLVITKREEVAAILDQIRPHLRMKEEQARLALEAIT